MYFGIYALVLSGILKHDESYLLTRVSSLKHWINTFSSMKKIASTGFQLSFCLIVLLSLSMSVARAQTFQLQIDSMQQLYEQTVNPVARLELLNEIAYSYRRLSPDSTLFYAEIAIEQARELGDDAALAYAYKNKGIGLFKLGASQDSIIYHYQQAVKYAERARDYYTQAACYNNIGLISLSNLSYNEAIQYFLRGVEVFDDHIKEESFLKALMLGNIGTAYHKDSDNTRGIPYYEEAIAMADRIGNKVIPSVFVDELARARMEEGDLEGAERDIIRILPLHDEIGDFESKTETLQTYAEVKIAQKDYSAAKRYALEAYQIANGRDFARNEAQSLMRLAEAYYGLEQLDSAKWCAIEALQKSKNGDYPIIRADIMDFLQQFFAQENNFAEAYRYARDYIELQEENRDETKQRIADDLEARYQNKQRIAEIDRLNLEKSTQQRRIYGLLGLVALILVVLAGMIYLSRQKAKATNALHQKNEELRQAEERLYDKNLELERYIESNLQLENFAHLASHDLREPMRNIVSFSQLLQRSAEERLTERELEFLSFIVHGTERIDGLVKDLLAYSTVSNSPLTITRVALSTLLSDVQEDLQQMFKETGANIRYENLPKHINADRSRLYQLFQNLLSNAVRYQRPEATPEIVITAEEQPGQFIFRVADNGIGIDPAYYEQIFVLFKSLENKTIQGSSGIGLATAKRVVEDHHGRIWVEQNKPFGSVFRFTISRNLDSV